MKKLLFILILILPISINAQFNYQRSWATYYFGNSTKVGGTVIDSNGDIIVVGTITINETNSYYTAFTTTTAHQPQVAGGTSDVFLAKFSPQGSLLWATYYGGEGNDMLAIYNYDCSYISLDSNDNIYIIGRTNSTNGIATTGSFLTVLPTTTAGFLTKFSPAGVLQWGTYFPGDISSIALDASDTIYIGGNTNATTDISTAGVFQENSIYNDGNSTIALGYNFFINKFDTQGNRLIGTYCGKADNLPDYFKLELAIDSEGSVYVSSSVITNPSPTIYSYASAGCHQSIRAGNNDIFLSKFNPELTQRIWSTYFGGIGLERCNAVISDDTDVYIVGYTTSSNNITTVGSYQHIISSSGGDGFLVKFDGGGTQQWGTYYGGNGVGEIENIKIKSGNIYITGETSSTTNIATTGAYQETFNNGGFSPVDGFFAQFTTDGLRNWGSYYGGEKQDYINYVAINNNGDVYLTGITTSSTNIATANSLQPNFNSGTSTTPRFNMFLAKFTYTPLGVSSLTKNNLQITPNPNNGNFVLQGNGLGQNSTVVVCDLQGRVMFTSEINTNNNEINQEFQLENKLSSGVYLVKILSENVALETVKIVVE
jgi:Secretion system C-terminal sorting domain